MLDAKLNKYHHDRATTPASAPDIAIRSLRGSCAILEYGESTRSTSQSVSGPLR
jgi:hypothetical protein